MENLEIKNEGKLLSEDGSLTTFGWARFPYLAPNAEGINVYSLKAFQQFRLKRWQYYAITTPTNFFSFTISHVGYLGLVFAYIVNFEKRVYHEETLNIPLGRGIHLPKDSLSGTASFEKGDLIVSFETAEDKTRFINVNWPNFGKQTLTAKLKITIPEQQESVVNVFPFDEKRFFYTRKVNCMQPEGEIKYDKVYKITSEDAFGTLDWGFGVWPYKSAWLWGSFSTKLPDGRTVGVNLGDKIGNNPDVTDNGVILDGKVHKLGKVHFIYDPSQLDKEWDIKSEDGTLKLKFEPFLVRLAKTDLKIISSVLHQVFGHYSGIFTTEDGKTIEVKEVIGWIEEHNARW